MKQNTVVKNGLILLFYITVAFIFNWSILCGKNLMKWDIMDAYYPLCMSSADMLRKGRLPLWNAAFQFGTPTYVMLGVPYWYPTTILFELTTGYSLICVAFDYFIHVVLACYGMYLLVYSHLRHRGKFRTCIIAVIAGCFYGFSGLFVSNAEHIMIIVSAAWLPYILVCVKKYFETNTKFFLITAALCMGLSILGGYPEVWIATFIILIPYFVIHSRYEERIGIRVFKAAFTYMVFAVGTGVSAAVSVIPFIASSKYIDRLNGGAAVNSYQAKMALSAILPHFTRFSKELGGTLDISMISMFMGILTLLLLGVSFFIKMQFKWRYMGLISFAFLMMLGNNAFLHPLFYKYFPLYSSLRFPSTWRCILTVFILLLAAQTLEEILGNEKSIKMFTLVCLITCSFFCILNVLLSYLVNSISEEIISGLKNDLKTDSLLCLIYAVIFAGIFVVGKNKNKDITFLLLLGTVVDIFVGQFILYPLTVTWYNQWDISAIKAKQGEIQVMFESDRNRSHSIEYNDAERSKNGLNSMRIVWDHTLDEEGYLSVLLNYVQTYKESEHCRLSSEMPVAYLTNNVVSREEMDFNIWLQDITVSPYQIFVEQKNSDLSDNKTLQKGIIAEHFISGDIAFDVSLDTGGYLVVQQSCYPGWNVYVDGRKEEIVQINGVFLGVYLKEGTHEVHFVFRPLDFYIGAILSVSYLTAFLISFVLYMRKIKETKTVCTLKEDNV